MVTAFMAALRNEQEAPITENCWGPPLPKGRARTFCVLAKVPRILRVRGAWMRGLHTTDLELNADLWSWI